MKNKLRFFFCAVSLFLCTELHARDDEESGLGLAIAAGPSASWMITTNADAASFYSQGYRIYSELRLGMGGLGALMGYIEYQKTLGESATVSNSNIFLKHDEVAFGLGWAPSPKFRIAGGLTKFKASSDEINGATATNNPSESNYGITGFMAYNVPVSKKIALEFGARYASAALVSNSYQSISGFSSLILSFR